MQRPISTGGIREQWWWCRCRARGGRHSSIRSRVPEQTSHGQGTLTTPTCPRHATGTTKHEVALHSRHGWPIQCQVQHRVSFEHLRVVQSKKKKKPSHISDGTPRTLCPTVQFRTPINMHDYICLGIIEPIRTAFTPPHESVQHPHLFSSLWP